MFRRIIVEEWQTALTILGLSLFGLVFTLNLVRIWCMPASQVRHLAHLPLEDRPTHE